LNAEALALRNSDPRRAIELATEALKLSSDLPSVEGRADALYVTGYANWVIGDTAAALGPLHESLKLFRTLGESAKEAYALAGIGVVHDINGNAEQGLTMLSDALEIFRDIDDREGTGSTLKALGNLYMGTGGYDAAEEHYRQALDLFEELGAERERALALMNIGSVNVRRGEFGKAVEYYTQCLAIHREVRNIRGEVQALGNLGVVNQVLGNFPRALESYMQAMEIEEAAGLLPELAVTYLQISNLYYDLSDFQSAAVYQTKSLSMRREHGDRQGEVNVLICLGNTYGSLRDIPSALDCHLQALELCRSLGNQEIVAQCLGNLGSDYRQIDDHARAIECYLQAIALAREIDEKAEIEFYALLDMGEIYLAGLGAPIHDPDSLEELRDVDPSTMAVPYFRRALAIAEASGRKPSIFQSHRALVDAYKRHGDVERALHHLELYHEIEKEVFNEESDRRLKNLHVIHETEKAMKEREVFRLRAVQLEQENEHKAKELSAIALHLAQKNNMLADLRKQAKEIAYAYAGEAQKLANAMVREIDAAMNTDDAWRTFNEQFEQIHHDFVKTLTQKFPSLSPTELKVCALLKINLTTKEIASILAVSVRTIEDHRTNIRKKLGIDSKTNFVTFLAGQ
jgi:tetratricopeptide (TPR) repeat protein/DNA-binding CsgD family transcriptional regulator